MAIVYCKITYDTDENDSGIEVDCVWAKCPRCGHQEMAWGDGEDSVKRALVTLRENCRCRSNDFYKPEKERPRLRA